MRYPSCCTSSYCGRVKPACDACVNGPTLREFERWREETAAVPVDPIWCRGSYVATREPVSGDPGWRRPIRVTCEGAHPTYVRSGNELVNEAHDNAPRMEALRRACLDGIKTTYHATYGDVTFERA